MAYKKKKKFGPKPIEITDDMIRQLETLAAYGLTQGQIALVLGMAKPTLENKLRDNPVAKLSWQRGKAKGIANVAKTVYNAAMNGDKASAFFYLKTQAGWRETQSIEHSGAGGGAIELVIKDYTRNKGEK